MKWYSYLILALALVLVLLLVQNTTTDQALNAGVQTAPTGLVTQNQQPTDSAVGGRTATTENGAVVRMYALFIEDDQFAPNTFELNEGETLRLILSSDTYETIDFMVPAVGYVEELDIAEEAEISGLTEGTYDFFCTTCSPELHGTILVHGK